MASRPVFEQNLARLRRRHARLAEAVAAADASAIEVVHGPTGAITLADRDVRLASAYDPRGEGERLAASVPEPADLLVAVGLSLGHHVEAFLARGRKPVIVYEPSVERLRAVLELRELDWIQRPEVHWADAPDQLGDLYGSLYSPGLAGRLLVHPVVLRLDPDAAREVAVRVARVKSAVEIAAQTRVQMTAAWSALTAHNAPSLLRTPSASRLFGAFDGVPAVVAAAGPSLDKQLPLLAREQDRLLIVAIGQALPALRRAGIRPDLVHVVESKDVSHQLEDGADTSLVVPPSVHPRLFEVPVAARFVSYPAPNALGRWIAGALGDEQWLPGGATVAQSAVHLAVALGANPILLIGQDLAFTGGRVYASGSAYDMVSFEEVEPGRYVFRGLEEKKALLGIEPPPEPAPPGDLVWVEGWDGDRVPTSKLYASFAEYYRAIGAWLAQHGLRLVNCTEGGARLPGLDHQPFEATLRTLPARRVAKTRTIRAAFEQGPPRGASRVAARVAGARRSLLRLERAAREGLRRAELASDELHRARGAVRRRDLLRGVARAERRVHRELAGVPWLDVVAQAELYEGEVAALRERDESDPLRAVGMARRLFRTAIDAQDRARLIVDRLEERLAPDTAGGPGA
ncbi:MAG: DUF115 domain-containing protein [Myxococcota bacterium]|nr:DUF115 domain-containing protein [Myxococcota bacterium]